MGSVLKTIAPIASFIPGVGPLVGAGLGAIGNATSGGGSNGGSNPYATLSNAMGPYQAAQAAQQNANQAKSVMNQSAVQDTSATNAAIQQIQQLIAGLQGVNPTTQTTYQKPAGAPVTPQQWGSMIPTTQGQAPNLAQPGASTMPLGAPANPGAVRAPGGAGAPGAPVQIGVGPQGHATMWQPGMPGSDPSYSQHAGGYTFNGLSGTPGDAVSAPTLQAAENAWTARYGPGAAATPPAAPRQAQPIARGPIGAPRMQQGY